MGRVVKVVDSRRFFPLTTICCLIATGYLLLATGYLSAATQCDLEWQTPREVAYQGLNYVAWFYEIKNNTDQDITVPVNVFLATDTGGRHIDRYNPGVEKILVRSEEHTSELQSQSNLVCRLLLEKKI